MAYPVVLLVCLALIWADGGVQAASSSANTNDLTDILSTIKGRLTPSTCDPLDLLTQGLVREIEARVKQQTRFERNIAELQNQLTSKLAEITNKSAIFAQDEGLAIVFSAKATANQQVVTSITKINFGTVVTNIGDAYNGATSTFNCPVKGVYQFTVNIVTTANHYIQTELMAAGVSRMQTYSAGVTSYAGSGSNTVLLELKAGDEVYVRQVTAKSGTYVYGTWSTFSGHLVPYWR